MFRNPSVTEFLFIENPEIKTAISATGKNQPLPKIGFCGCIDGKGQNVRQVMSKQPTNSRVKNTGVAFFQISVSW